MKDVIDILTASRSQNEKPHKGRTDEVFSILKYFDIFINH